MYGGSLQEEYDGIVYSSQWVANRATITVDAGELGSRTERLTDMDPATHAAGLFREIIQVARLRRSKGG